MLVLVAGVWTSRRKVAIVKSALSGSRGVFAITLAALWSVIAIAAIVLGIWGDPPALAWIGLVIPLLVATGLSIGAYVLLRHERPRVGIPVSERAPVSSDVHRILVVANATLRGSALRDEVVRRAAGLPTEVLVVAPALSSPIAHWTDAEDAARADARARVGATCARLSHLGVGARGEVAVDDPLRAVEDALRSFGADEIIVSTHPPGASNWLERDVVDRLREFYDIPVIHVVVDHERELIGSPSEALG
jgi:hypothetical protein